MSALGERTTTTSAATDRREPTGRPAPRRTKIVCTLGPSTSTQEMVDALVEAGMDCARLNFSHGSHSEHAGRYRLVREAQRRAGRPLAVMADLQGPKLRVAKGADPVELSQEQEVALYGVGEQAPGFSPALPVDPPVLAEVLEPGHQVLLNDGLVRLEVEERRGDHTLCRVLQGGLAKPRHGVCLPGVELPIPSMTRKDLDDLEFALSLGVDYVALSFVRSAEDVYGLKMQIASLGYDALVVAKIEQAEALTDLDMIVEAADAVMVARGDLGVELGPEGVPLEQKRIIACALDHGKPVITATQMLESMSGQPAPTRAEASDVANAVLDGSAAVMTSGETATGAYPIETVTTMDRIARHVEERLEPRPNGNPLDDPDHGPTRTAITSGAAHIAGQLKAAVIVVPTTSGSTPSAVARHRPHCPIVGVSPNERALQRMALEWGVVPLPIVPHENVEDLWEDALSIVRAAGLVEEGEQVVITAGSAMNLPGSTDLIKVIKVIKIIEGAEAAKDTKAETD